MKKYLSLLMCLFVGSWMLVSCNDDDDRTWVVSEPVADGVLILNQGSYFSQIDGSIDFLDYGTNKVFRNCFKNKNNRALGGTPNSVVGVTVGGKNYLFVACCDENRIEVMDAFTFESIKAIEVPSPRCLDVASNGSVYVTSYDGRVRKINPATREIDVVSEKIGDYLEGIVVMGNYVYVCDAYSKTDPSTFVYHTNVVKLNASNLARVKNITVAANPNILLTDGTNVYVDCWGNYADVNATVQQINASDEVTTLTSARLMALYKDKLYLVNTTYDEHWNEVSSYKVFNLNTKEEKTFVAGSEIVSPVAIGVDQLTGDVFISSYSKNADTGMIAYAGDGYLARYKQDGTFVDRYTVGVGPGSMIFYFHWNSRIVTDPSQLPSGE